MSDTIDGGLIILFPNHLLGSSCSLINFSLIENIELFAICLQITWLKVLDCLSYVKNISLEVSGCLCHAYSIWFKISDWQFVENIGLNASDRWYLIESFGLFQVEFLGDDKREHHLGRLLQKVESQQNFVLTNGLFEYFVWFKLFVTCKFTIILHQAMLFAYSNKRGLPKKDCAIKEGWKVFLNYVST